MTTIPSEWVERHKLTNTDEIIVEDCGEELIIKPYRIKDQMERL